MKYLGTPLLFALACTSYLMAADSADEGKRLYLANHLPAARAVLESVVKANDSDQAAHFWLAYTCLGLGDLDAAIDHFSLLEKTMAQQPEYLFAISEAYLRRARELATKLVSNGVYSSGVYSARVHQLSAYHDNTNGEWEAAISELRRAAALAPNTTGIHLDAGKILWDHKKFDEAAVEFEAELKLNPLDLTSNLRYGQHLVQKGRFAEAIRPLEIATRYRKYPEAHRSLAFAFERLQKPAEAMAVILAGLMIFPQEQGLAKVLQDRKGPTVRGMKKITLPGLLREPEPDVAALRAALGRNPEDEDALFLLTRLYGQRSEYYIGKLEEVAPDSARLWQAKGLGAEFLEDFRTAEQYFRKALEKQPQLVGGHVALGGVLRAQGRDEEARKEAELELKRDPAHAYACYMRGSILLSEGNTSAAIASLEKALRIRPDLNEARVELAKAYVNTKREALAIPLLQKAIAQNPHHEVAHFLLYKAYRSAGEVELARQQLVLHQKLLPSRISPTTSNHSPDP